MGGLRRERRGQRPGLDRHHHRREHQADRHPLLHRWHHGDDQLLGGQDNQSLSSQVAVVLTDVDGNQSSCTSRKRGARRPRCWHAPGGTSHDCRRQQGRAAPRREGEPMSTCALVIGRGRLVGLRPPGRWGRAVVPALLTLLVLAGLELVRPLVSADRSSSSPPAEGTWPAGCGRRPMPPSPPTPTASQPTPMAPGPPAPPPTACAAVRARRAHRRGPMPGGWAWSCPWPASVAPASWPRSARPRWWARGRRRVPPGADLVEWYRNDPRGLEQGFTWPPHPAAQVPSSWSWTPPGWPGPQRRRHRGPGRPGRRRHRPALQRPAGHRRHRPAAPGAAGRRGPGPAAPASTTPAPPTP